MKKTFFKIIIILFASFCFGLNAGAKTTTKPAKTTTKQFVRIFYCQNGKLAEESFSKNFNSVDILAPQAYSVSATGTLTGGVSEKLTTIAKKRNKKIMPLVVNRSFKSDLASEFLDNPEYQTNAIRAMVKEAVDKHYAGWQVDFEQIDIGHRDAFTGFVRSLTDALHEVNLISSVAVIAQTSTNPNDYPKDYWYKFIGAYDYAGLASSSDFISIMSYDDPGSEGPVTRFTWLQQVLDYTLKSVPPEKISIGIPLYYWRWNDTTGKRVGIGGYKQFITNVNQHYVTYGYDQVEHTAYVKYRSKKMNYTIWYENKKSVQKKVDLIKKYGLHGLSAWALGQEVPSVHAALTTNKYKADLKIAGVKE